MESGGIIKGADKEVEEEIKCDAPTAAHKGILATYYPGTKKYLNPPFHTRAMIADPAMSWKEMLMRTGVSGSHNQGTDVIKLLGKISKNPDNT